MVEQKEALYPKPPLSAFPIQLFPSKPLDNPLVCCFDGKKDEIAHKCAKSNEKQLKSHNIGPRSMSSAVRTGKGNRDGTMPYGAVRTDAVVTAKSVPERPASMESDRFGVVGASICTMAVHDGMKGLVHAVCVHGLAWKGAFPMFSCHFGHGEDAETAAS